MRSCQWYTRLTPGLVDGGLQAAAVIAWLVHTKIVYTDVTVDTSQNLPPTMVSLCCMLTLRLAVAPPGPPYCRSQGFRHGQKSCHGSTLRRRCFPAIMVSGCEVGSWSV